MTHRAEEKSDTRFIGNWVSGLAVEGCGCLESQVSGFQDWQDLWRAGGDSVISMITRGEGATQAYGLFLYLLGASFMMLNTFL